MSAGFHIENFGCRAARADGEAIADRLRSGGLCAGDADGADVVIVNTCSVTAEADRSARAFIRRTHRHNPAARIVVTGCYAQRAPEELAAIPGVAAVVGNSHKALAPEIAKLLSANIRPGGEAASQHVSEMASQPGGAAADFAMVDVKTLLASRSGGAAPVWADDRFAHSFLEEAQVVPGAQTRPNLKIQEGCSNRCTFCVIPQTRGRSRSLAAANVLAQVERFLAAGGKELVLSGINLGRWGRDGGESPSLAALVRRIFAETKLPRLRLSSIEPMDWDAELIGVMREFGGERLARHAHLPLQSGSDAVLRRMHRRYRPWHYAERVHAVLEAAGPELTLGADVMAGFPGETDAEFRETCDLIESLPFGYLHLFPFSPRPGTRGWELHRQQPVAAEAVAERMAALRDLAHTKMAQHRNRFVGSVVDALTLHTPADLATRGRTVALSENFLPVEVEECLPANELIKVRVFGVNGDLSLQATNQWNSPADAR